MVKKIENEGSTLIVSTSEELDNLDIESMLEKEEEPETPAREPANSVDIYNPEPEKTFVEFIEEGTNKNFGGFLQSFYEDRPTANIHMVHITVVVDDQQFFELPIGHNVRIDQVNFVYKDQIKPLMSEETWIFRLVNVERSSDDLLRVFITLQ